MNRRDFLKNLGLIAIPAIVAPKLIFDYGANKRQYLPKYFYGIDPGFGEDSTVVRILNPEWEVAPYEEIIASYKKGYWNTKIIRVAPREAVQNTLITAMRFTV